MCFVYYGKRIVFIITIRMLAEEHLVMHIVAYLKVYYVIHQIIRDHFQEYVVALGQS